MKSKHQSFIAEASNQEKVIPHSQAIISQVTEPEKIRHTLIGSSFAVTRTIQVLQKLGYANVRDWTPLVPTSNPGEVMSVLIRSITVE
ncbi:hypothetical protein NIES267_55900 [Calothrix parasitica NIES-267]|uniref:Uncharacterized protein n=1 Tax=Calothrix parasitica NIES-267 TaxID=1973488 RepID=A0A1Z4LXX2_9CYAN|nr:hypothetical protein NIES267_55900 [Calothrix parasitica NIES-267]